MSRLAIDAGGTWIRYEIIGEEEACGRVLSKETELCAFVTSLLKKYPDIDAVAVSFAGQVNEGVILSAPNIDIDEPEIENFIENVFGIPLKIENDLNCAALAESVYWNERELAAIYSGTGLGCGIVSNGEIVRGWRGMAGEIGHIPYKKTPLRCGCGKDNCIELYASGSGIKKWMRYYGCEGDPDLGLLLDSQRAECFEIATNYVEALVWASATIVTLINPRTLVLGGGVVKHNPIVVKEVEKRVGDYALQASCNGLEVVMSRLQNASLEGAKLLLDTMTTIKEV